jgi:RNA polymerase-interacting CarD/CdnL/TRCF family regulator
MSNYNTKFKIGDTVYYEPADVVGTVKSIHIHSMIYSLERINDE